MSSSDAPDLANGLNKVHLSHSPDNKLKEKAKKSRKNHRGGRKGKKKATQGSEATATPTEASTEMAASELSGGQDAGDSEHSSMSARNYKRYFEMRSAPDGGLGHFAITAIPTGTRIICEPPLMTIDEIENTTDAICEQFFELSASDQQLLLSLESTEDEISSAFRHRIEALEKIIESEKDQTTLEACQEELSRCTMEFKAVATFRTNCINMQGSPNHTFNLPVATVQPFSQNEQQEEGSDDDFDDAKPQAAGVFPTAARLNHSCLPNTYLYFNCRTNLATVHTTRAISAGQELTFSYLGGSTFYQHQSLRQQTLTRWGFICTCPACVQPNQHEANRRQIWKTQFNLQLVLKAYAEREDSTMTADEADAVLQMALQNIILLEKERCADFEMARVRQKAAEMCAVLGKWKAAALHAKKGLQIVETCVGRDNEEFVRFDAFVREIEERVEEQMEAEKGKKRGRGKGKR